MPIANVESVPHVTAVAIVAASEGLGYVPARSPLAGPVGPPPPLIVIGSHALSVLFHARTWPFVGAVLATKRPRKYAASWSCTGGDPGTHGDGETSCACALTS